MELTTVLFDVADRVATITLNRPDARNAATFEMEQELIHCFAEADADPAVGCIVLTGAGKGFCAGDDVTKAWGDPRMEATLAELASPNPPITPLVGAMLATDTPTVAAVNGAAVGIGMDLALLCDLRIASEYARFAQLYVKLGLMCDVTGIWLLPQIVGQARATELLLTGEIIDATEAARIGLVSRVVGADDLMPAAYEIARSIAANPPLAVRAIKQGLRLAAGQNVRRAARPCALRGTQPVEALHDRRSSRGGRGLRRATRTAFHRAMSTAGDAITSGAREVSRFEVAELVAELVGSTDEDNLTVPEHDDPVGDVERVGRVLLDEDHARHPRRPRRAPRAGGGVRRAARDPATARRRGAAAVRTPGRGRA